MISAQSQQTLGEPLPSLSIRKEKKINIFAELEELYGEYNVSHQKQEDLLMS